MRRSRRQTTAATTAFIAGLGFGMPCLLGIRHLAATGDVWLFLGFPTYGDGPFERAGIRTSVALLAGFLAICIAEITLAVLITRNARSAKTLSSWLLPIELTYWIGFALPVGPVLGLARIALAGQLADPRTLTPPTASHTLIWDFACRRGDLNSAILVYAE
jgi:hypothetical protein